MSPQKVLAVTKLCIKDQKGLLTHIARTYRDFYRAAMEYIDNSIDASCGIAQSEKNPRKFKIVINIDSKNKEVTFLDNCGGMSPDELGALLSHIGASRKKAVPWANGQFGFGVHAARGFAMVTKFISKKEGHPESEIIIDREADENIEVPIMETERSILKENGTLVGIQKFDKHVFTKYTLAKYITAQIQEHFDDVLRAGLVDIIVTVDGYHHAKCQYFDFNALKGKPFKQEIIFDDQGHQHKVTIDLKILDVPHSEHNTVINNKQRQIQRVADLPSFKEYLKRKDESIDTWANPYLVGYIEVDDLCQPNLSRDDFVSGDERDVLFEHLLKIQRVIKKLIDEKINDKTQDSYNKLGKLMSDCLSDVLKKFKLDFDIAVPTDTSGKGMGSLQGGLGAGSFGGAGPGGGSGPGPGTGGTGGGSGTGGPGQAPTGGAGGKTGQQSQTGSSITITQKSYGPQIIFMPQHDGERVIDLGGSLIINTVHKDFLERNKSKSGLLKLDSRIINYVSIVVSPYCVHRLFAKQGKMPSVLESGTNMVNLSTKLESYLNANAMFMEVEIKK